MDDISILHQIILSNLLGHDALSMTVLKAEREGGLGIQPSLAD